MTEAFKAYNDTFKAETDAMIDLIKGLLSGSRSGDEVSQQIDQHISNMDQAADQYWQQRNIRPAMMLCCVPDGYDTQALPCAGGDGSCAESLCELWDDLEAGRLSEETVQARLNGGRTGWLFDDDGNEYYTTEDGIRHYTREEG